MSSVLKCPACHHPLAAQVEVLANRKTIYLYCSYGPCQPAELNDGFPGATVEESYEGLKSVYQRWLEGQQE